MARAAARPDEIRRHNLGLLLEQVHRDGELSRAELTQRLGLNRSTIGALVSDLTEVGLLSEFVPTSSDRAGRPSHVVGPRADGPFAIAVDIEVDRVVSATVGLGGHLLLRRETLLEPGHRDPFGVADVVAEHTEYLLDATVPPAWVVGLGMSVPGTVTRDGGMVAHAPNLGWHDLPFAQIVLDRLASRRIDPLPVAVGNDADLGVLAEHLRGAARGCDDIVYLTGRIGVGAGILVDGVPLRGHLGLAGEIGHVVLDPAGPPCHCGNRGCVETYIGQPAVLAAAGRSAEPGRDGIASLFDAVRAGDPDAIRGVRSVAEPLGRTIAAMVNMLNPQLVVLGGVLGGVLDLAESQILDSVDRHVFASSGGELQLRGAALGSDSSLMGASELAFQRLLADPFIRGMSLRG